MFARLSRLSRLLRILFKDLSTDQSHSEEKQVITLPKIVKHLNSEMFGAYAQGGPVVDNWSGVYLSLPMSSPPLFGRIALFGTLFGVNFVFIICALMYVHFHGTRSNYWAPKPSRKKSA